MTTFQKIALPFCLGCLLAFSWVITFKLGQHYAPTSPGLPVNVQTDTLVIRDTIRENYPAPVQSTPKGYELVKAGTLAELRAHISALEAAAAPDTIEVQIPVEIERKTYQGDDYRAVVSGWRPSLEEIAVYPKTVYLQTEVTQPPAHAPRRGPRAGIGIAAGPGAFWTPQAGVQFGAGAVVGLSVTF